MALRWAGGVGRGEGCFPTSLSAARPPSRLSVIYGQPAPPALAGAHSERPLSSAPGCRHSALGPVDVPSRHCKGPERCLCSRKGQPVPSPQPRGPGPSPLPSGLARPLDRNPGRGEGWGLCFRTAFRTGDAVCEVKCGALGQQFLGINTVTAEPQPALGLGRLGEAGPPR